MSDKYYNDLREFVDALDKRGLLYRWQRPVNKDSELMPLMRLQYRGRADAEPPALLYEKDPADMYERCRHAVAKPIDPVTVQSGPVHEEVHVGAELEKIGLAMIPAPVGEPGFSGDNPGTGPL